MSRGKKLKKTTDRNVKRIAELNAENTTLKESIKTATTSVETLKESLDSFGEELDRVNEAIESKDSEISALKSMPKESKATNKKI